VLKCFLNKHDFDLTHTFRVPVTNEDRTEIIMLAPVAFALECEHCGKRKLQNSRNPYGEMAWGIQQDAKIWLETGIIHAGEPLYPETTSEPEPEWVDITEPIEESDRSITLVVDNNG